MQHSHLVHGVGAQKWAPGPSVHTIFVSSKQSTALFSLRSACFKMVSDRANTGPLCAGTQALAPEHQVWTAPYTSNAFMDMVEIKMCLKINRSVKTP